jgi:hypothetical protein
MKHVFENRTLKLFTVKIMENQYSKTITDAATTF